MSTAVRTSENESRNPFRSLISNFFDSDFLDAEFFNRGNFPPVNVKETERSYELELASPGFDKGDFNVELKDNVLTVSAENTKEKVEEDENFSRREFKSSSFSRSFSLPANVEEDSIQATYKNGVLKISVQKSGELELPQAKKIEIH